MESEAQTLDELLANWRAFKRRLFPSWRIWWAEKRKQRAFSRWITAVFDAREAAARASFREMEYRDAVQAADALISALETKT